VRFILFFSILFMMSLHARENPFAPVENGQNTVTAQTKTAKTKKVKPQTKIHPQRRVDHTETISTPQRPRPKIHPVRVSEKAEVINTSKARFVFRNKSLYIETKDKIIKHFYLPSPPSIVIDFKSKSDFASKRQSVTMPPFTKLEMGAHNTRYRVVLRLDKKHHYKIDKKRYGQFITILD